MAFRRLRADQARKDHIDVDNPETLFAWSGDIALAYQVIGNGPVDLVYLQGYVSQIDMNWESPYLARFLRGLARHGRLIITDRRGWGCSERFAPHDIPDIDTLTDDILAVMEAAGSSRAAVMATWESTLIASLFAATYPERTVALILVDPLVSYAVTDETPWMPTLRDWDETVEMLRRVISTDTLTAEWPEGREREWFARYQRASVAPGAILSEIRRYLDVDIRAIIPTIQVPTLVFADRDGQFETKVESGRFIAGKIHGARLIEQSSAGGPHRVHWYARGDAIVAEVGQFLARIREEEASFDRALATLLFTDIVRSTEKAAELGDPRWRELLQQHHSIVRMLLARYRGKEIDTAGDGFFASFDGPARALRCAMAIVEAVRPLGIEVRAGLHTGEVDSLGDKVGGIAVNIGARVAAMAGPSEILVSSTVRDLVAGSGLAFEDRGLHSLKGIPGEWRCYAVAMGIG
jgi:class 3 adenylate cyclase